MKVSTRLYGAVGTLALTGVLVGIAGISYSRKMGEELRIATEKTAMKLDLVNATRARSWEMVAALRGMFISASIKDASGVRDNAGRWSAAYKRIGEQTAERIKITIGNAYPLEQQLTMEVKGRDMVAGIPKTVVVNSDEIRDALNEPTNAIVEAVLIALERTPPELAADIVDKGIVLTGGGALLKNLDVLLREETGLPVMVCDDPISAVVLGSGKALDHLELLKEVTIS